MVRGGGVGMVKRDTVTVPRTGGASTGAGAYDSRPLAQLRPALYRLSIRLPYSLTGRTSENRCVPPTPRSPFRPNSCS